MSKPTKRRRSKKRRPDFFLKNRILLIIMGCAGLLVAVMVWLARLEERPQVPVPPPVVKPQVDDIKKVTTEVEAFLGSLKTEPGNIQRDLDQEPARYTVIGEFPSPDMVAGFRDRVHRIQSDYDVRYREANSLTVEKSRMTKIIILFLPPPPRIPAGPLVAIIMDDLGRSAQTAQLLAAIVQPVTFAILPDEPLAVEVAEIAHAAGREVMLHVPMEPQGYPAVNPGPDALFVKNSDEQIRDNFNRLLARIPHVAGTNNHMGSRFTEDARALTPVMESLRDRGLFFIDSRTTGHSKAPEVASRFGVPTLNRDVFLDNVAEVDAIVREIRRLEGKARRQGMAIGICHPYPETLAALQSELPGLAERGITVVPVSMLLRKQALNHGS